MKYKKIDLAGLDIEIDPELAKAFIDHRLTMKKPLTQFAFDSQMKKSLRGHEISMTPNEVIKYVCEETTWQGIDVEYIASNLNDKRQAMERAMKGVAIVNANIMRGVSTRDIPLGEQLTDRSWADNPQDDSPENPTENTFNLPWPRA